MTLGPQWLSGCSILVFKDGETHVVQLLEHDIVAQGTTASQAAERFTRALIHQILDDMWRGDEPLSRVPPAPEWCWERYRAENAP